MSSHTISSSEDKRPTGSPIPFLAQTTPVSPLNHNGADHAVVPSPHILSSTSAPLPKVVSPPPLVYLSRRSSGTSLTTTLGATRRATQDTITVDGPVKTPSSDLKSYFASCEPKTAPLPERFAYRISVGYFAYFMCGWGDGVMATVLPHLMAEFNITFMTSSLFYAASTSGFLIGTFLLERILQRLGQVYRTRDQSSWFPCTRLFSRHPDGNLVRFSSVQAKHLGISIGSILHAMFFLVMGTRGGFPAIFVAHMIAAFARALLTGCLNTYFSIVPKHVGYAYAFWSFGGVLAPLVCQAVMARGVPWWHFYLGTLVASALNSTLLAVSYRPTPLEFTSEKSCLERSPSLSPTSTKHEDENAFSKSSDSPKSLLLALRQPLQWAISIFAGLYFSSETTSQGFMVSFLLETRNGDPRTTGYVTCGFWAGIMIGRLLWGFLTPLMNPSRRRCAIELCLLLTLGMQFLIWFVPSVPVSGAALAVIGLLYGPVFPACLNLANDLLPEELRMVTMALISCFASTGCAIIFFVAGIILSQKGIHTLPYINVTLTGILAIYWLGLPTKKRAPNLSAGGPDQKEAKPIV